MVAELLGSELTIMLLKLHSVKTILFTFISMYLGYCNS